MLVVITIIAILAGLLSPVLSAAKNRAGRVTCSNNLRQINLGVRMYADDSNDKLPRRVKGQDVCSFYKAYMKSYVGLTGASSARDRLFACPADVFYYDIDVKWPGPFVGYVPESLCSQSNLDFSSYTFNGWNQKTNVVLPGIAGMTFSSIKHPARTVLLAEFPAFEAYSWHQPKRPLVRRGQFRFNNAMDVVSFADGHVSYIKMFWQTEGLRHDPAEGYDYQWSGN